MIFAHKFAKVLATSLGMLSPFWFFIIFFFPGSIPSPCVHFVFLFLFYFFLLFPVSGLLLWVLCLTPCSAPHFLSMTSFPQLEEWEKVFRSHEGFPFPKNRLCGLTSKATTGLPVTHGCIPGIKPTCLWWVILAVCCWIWFASILLRILAFVCITDISL